MKVLIINLAREKARREFQSRQMKQLQLDFQFVEAVSVDDIPAEEIEVRSHEWERPMRPVEVACLYSHRRAWQQVLDSGEPALILEDDALLSIDTPAILSALKDTKLGSHITLEARGRKKLLGNQSQNLAEGFKATRLYQDRTGAAAYVLWPQGAKILLNNSDKAAGLADAIIAASYELNSWQIEPAPAIQLDQCDHYKIPNPLETVSSISSAQNKKPAPANALQGLKFKFRRIKAQLRMGLRQLVNITRSNRRDVTVEIKQ